MDDRTPLQNPSLGAPEKRTPLAWGCALVGLGLWMLASNLWQWEWSAIFPLGLGLLFLVWGSATRTLGLLIPGGILTGIGAGALLLAGPFSHLEESASGGLFLVSFGAGWLLTTLTAALFMRRLVWWPLIPGGIMLLTGGALLIGGPALVALAYFGQGWPLVLIVIGLYLLLWRKGLQE
jgi:hypothetical protein